MSYIVFQNPKSHWILYDREINKFLKISDKDALAIQGKLGVEIQQDVKKIYQNKGVCCKSQLKEIEHPGTQYLQYYLDNQVGDLILQVTQNCNLRCDYCAFSGKYYTRTHQPKRMSFELACKGVDFLISHSRDQEEVTLGFYGGEPLLEFDLIKKIIQYAEENYDGKKIRYSMTVNGTLLTEEIVSFLESKEADLMVSLDGPQEIHDAHRHFPNGNGSHRLVMENLRQMKERHPKYFATIRTNTVISPDQDCEKIRLFLEEDPVLLGCPSNITSVSDVGSKEPIVYDDSFSSMNKKEQMKLMLNLMGTLDSALVSSTHRYYLNELSVIYKASQNVAKLPEKMHPGGPCIAGVKKLFVDVDGMMYPCERVGETPAMQIGSLDFGFDIEKVKQIINVGRLTPEECKNCWAFYYCNMCVGLTIEGEIPQRSKRLSRCNETRMNIVSKMQDLCFLIDNGVDFQKPGEFSINYKECTI